MEQLSQKIYSSKVKVFITVEPYNIRLATLFNSNDSLGAIKSFVVEKMKILGIKFEIGRIELKEKLAILLPEFTVGDFLENNSEVVAYSQEFGLNMRTLPGDGMDQRPFFQKPQNFYNQTTFTKKKTNRNHYQNKNQKKNDKKNKPENKQNERKNEVKKPVDKKESKKEFKKEEKVGDKKETKEVKEIKHKPNKEKENNKITESEKKEKNKKEEKKEKNDKNENKKLYIAHKLNTNATKEEKKASEYIPDSDDDSDEKSKKKK